MMARSISLRQVDAFRAFMSTGSVGGAAKSLNVSQPAVSKLLSNFEADTSIQLFIRKAGRLLPTQQAYQVHSEVERVFTGLRQIEAAIDRIRRAKQKKIAIGIMPALAGAFASRVITRFSDIHPEAHISVVVRHSSYIVDQVTARNLDIGLINWAATGPVLKTVPFMRRDLVCIMPPDHPLVDQDVVTAEDLHGQKFIAFHTSNNTRFIVQDLLDRLGVAPNVVAEVTTSITICMMVASGLGISVIHPIHLQERHERLVVRKFRPATALHLMICHRNDSNEYNSLIPTFIEVISGEQNFTGPAAAP